MIREALTEDLDAILELYLYLHESSIPEKDAHLCGGALDPAVKRRHGPGLV